MITIPELAIETLARAVLRGLARIDQGGLNPFIEHPLENDAAHIKEGSKTGAGSPPATTEAPTSLWPQSLLPQSSSGGSNES